MNKILIILFGILTLPVWALDDTVTNREIQTDRYIAARPTKEVMDVLMDSYLKTDESSLFKQQEQKDLVHKYCDIDTITKEMKVSMVRIYTADELKALADFYESPAAKSALKKSFAYMVDLEPELKLELSKAIFKVKMANLSDNSFPISTNDSVKTNSSELNGVDLHRHTRMGY